MELGLSLLYFDLMSFEIVGKVHAFDHGSYVYFSQMISIGKKG